ncbi:T9SS type A sorting domain-containing protein [Candidatus Poribacteria bacterium]|nr:T9SS type A sorting domain-containing protein [Candidatus Poribacteria bacterium]
MVVGDLKAQNQSISLPVALDKMHFARGNSNYTADQMEKCLFPYISTIVDNWDSMPALMRQDVKAMFQRPDNPHSWWYKAGLPLKLETPHFRFHYTLTGPDAVLSEDVSPLNGIPDLEDVCAEAYEKSYRVEIQELGYRKPYDDYWTLDNGGNEKYDVYFFSGPWLGFTMPELYISSQSTVLTTSLYFGMNSHIYQYFGASEGEKYAQTTCAHEFFHSIQFAYNLYMPRWYMEASSTWIERMVYDGSEQGETDANNYYNSQLVYWFRYPDWSLTKFDGWHEYGCVIWNLFLTEKYDVDIVKDFFEDFSEGTYRDLVNFYDSFINRGTNLGAAFKEFTLWNYFTNYRYDDRFYSRGFDYPPVSVHPSDIHENYPVKVDFDSEQSPENLGARYIRFLPAPGQNKLSLKIDGSDIIKSDDLQTLDLWGTRGFGAKLVVYRQDKAPVPDEIFLFQNSQEGQKNFDNFGRDVQEVVLIISNLNPDLDVGSISYSAGKPPEGKLSEPQLRRNDRGEVIVSWELLDLSGIKEIAIVRKRFSPMDGDTDDSIIKPNESYQAGDANEDGIPDSRLNIVGKVSPTDTTFVDNTTFTDVFSATQPGFDYSSVVYYYAVVPVNEYGIMGTPSMAKNGITPTAPPPTIFINTQMLAPGEWNVRLTASLPLGETPELKTITPDGRRITVEMVKVSEDNQLWQGKLLVPFFPTSGTYTYVVSARSWAGSEGTKIASGRQFQYAEESEKQEIICYPNPFNPDVDEKILFRPPGFKIQIFSLSGEMIKEVKDSQWDGTNQFNQPVSSGNYIYHAEGDGYESTGKIAVIR